MSEFEEQVKEMSFEDSLKALEELVKELEAGGIDLDRSIEVYEKAVILREHCKSILDDSERKIQKIMETSSGVKTQDLDFQ